MRRSHGFGLLILVVAVAWFGWYRGWFTVNQERLKQDVGPAEQKVAKFFKQSEDKVQQELNKDNSQTFTK